MAHHHHPHSTDNLKVAFFLNLGFTIFEIIGGLYVNSIAIISDAVHDLGDSLSLGTAWYLGNKSHQSPDGKFSIGYGRLSLLGAFINSVVLIFGGIYVIKEAIHRLAAPEMTNAKGMLLFAIIGVLVNGYAAWKVSHGETLNEKAVSWHLIEDVLGWFVILIGSIVLLFWETPYLDPILSLGVSVFILWNVAKRLKETAVLFLQGVPDNVSIDELKAEILKIETVQSLHETHLWSLDGEHHVFTTHLKMNGILTAENILFLKEKINIILEKYHFHSHTIEIEGAEERCIFE